MPNATQLFEQAERMRRRADANLAEAERIEAKAHQVDRLWAEPPAGSILTWQRTYVRGPGTVYTYAALRVGSRWFTTGPVEANSNPGGRTWDSLIEWILGGLVGKLEVILPDRIEAQGPGVGAFLGDPQSDTFTGRRTRTLVG